MTDGGRATTLHYAPKQALWRRSRFCSITVPIRTSGTTMGSRRSIGSLGHQNPSIAMRFAACSAVRKRSPCVAIGDNDTLVATSRVNR
jgi:hypothetical protein